MIGAASHVAGIGAGSVINLASLRRFWGGGEVDFIAGAGRAAQSQSVELQDAFEVSE